MLPSYDSEQGHTTSHPADVLAPTCNIFCRECGGQEAISYGRLWLPVPGANYLRSIIFRRMQISWRCMTWTSAAVKTGENEQRHCVRMLKDHDPASSRLHPPRTVAETWWCFHVMLTVGRYGDRHGIIGQWCLLISIGLAIPHGIGPLLGRPLYFQPQSTIHAKHKQIFNKQTKSNKETKMQLLYLLQRRLTILPFMFYSVQRKKKSCVSLARQVTWSHRT